MKSYKNTHIVSAREIPAVFSYFSSYQYFREKNMSIFLSGSLAGTISWFITYPVDTIKTRLQNNSCKTIKEAMVTPKNTLKASFVPVCLIIPLLAPINQKQNKKTINIKGS